MSKKNLYFENHPEGGYYVYDRNGTTWDAFQVDLGRDPVAHRRKYRRASKREALARARKMVGRGSVYGELVDRTS